MALGQLARQGIAAGHARQQQLQALLYAGLA